MEDAVPAGRHFPREAFGSIDLRPGRVGTVTAGPAEAPTSELPVITVDGPKDGPSEPAGSRRRAEAIAAQVLFAVAAALVGFVIFVVFLSGLQESRAQSGLARRLAPPLQFGQAPIGGTIRTGTPVARLDIPSIGVHQVVVEGTTADQLRYGPAHLATSPLPGQIGNSVIAGHRLAWGGPFGEIGSLRPGAVIDVKTGQGQFQYDVVGHQTVSTKDVQPLEATKDNRLTLLTAADWTASHRLVVTAKLVGAPVPSPNGRPTVVAGTASGLTGQGGITLVLASWLELLIVVAVATVFVYRRLPGWSGYLITTPVVVAVLWLVYENLARALPGTL